MARIKCKTPSTGYVKNYTISNLSTSWTTLAEAPDFSVPDAQAVYPRDPSDSTRGIRSGEIFFLTPIFVRNKSSNTVYVYCQLVLEDGTTIACPGKIAVPADDTSLMPLQGRSLLNRIYTSTAGDKVQLYASTAGVIDLWASGEEKLSAEHTGFISLS